MGAWANNFYGNDSIQDVVSSFIYKLYSRADTRHTFIKILKLESSSDFDKTIKLIENFNLKNKKNLTEKQIDEKIFFNLKDFKIDDQDYIFEVSHERLTSPSKEILNNMYVNSFLQKTIKIYILEDSSYVSKIINQKIIKESFNFSQLLPANDIDNVKNNNAEHKTIIRTSQNSNLIDAEEIAQRQIFLCKMLHIFKTKNKTSFLNPYEFESLLYSTECLIYPKINIYNDKFSRACILVGEIEPLILNNLSNTKNFRICQSRIQTDLKLLDKDFLKVFNALYKNIPNTPQYQKMMLLQNICPSSNVKNSKIKITPKTTFKI